MASSGTRSTSKLESVTDSLQHNLYTVVCTHRHTHSLIVKEQGKKLARSEENPLQS